MALILQLSPQRSTSPTSDGSTSFFCASNLDLEPGPAAAISAAGLQVVLLRSSVHSARRQDSRRAPE